MEQKEGREEVLNKEKNPRPLITCGDTEITPLPYRPCTARGKTAIFHRWADKKEIVIQDRLRFINQEPNPKTITLALENAREGYVSPDYDIYTRRETVAIVEYEDGAVDEVSPKEIKFTEPPQLILRFSEGEI